MKKLATLALLLSLGVFAVGCAAQEDTSAPAAGTEAAPASTEAPPADAAAPPAEGAAQ